jgi:hypothetical protein
LFSHGSHLLRRSLPRLAAPPRAATCSARLRPRSNSTGPLFLRALPCTFFGALVFSQTVLASAL